MMFIHVGEEHIISADEIIAIIDYSLVSSSTINDELLVALDEKESVVVTDEALSKSVVFTADKVYYSPLSVLTLRKRSSVLSTISRLDDYSEPNQDE